MIHCFYKAFLIRSLHLKTVRKVHLDESNAVFFFCYFSVGAEVEAMKITDR